MSASSIVQVAVAIILHRGRIAVAWRDGSLAQGNCFEFPGGKLEPGEDAVAAAVREISEELGLLIQPLYLWHRLQHDYPGKTVQLQMIRARLSDRDTQGNGRVRWVAPDDLSQLPFPAANQLFINRLLWPRELAIVPPPHVPDALHIRTGIQLAYLRQWSLEQVNAYLAGRALALADAASDPLNIMVNLAVFQQLNLPHQQQIFAIHLNHSQLHDPATPGALAQLRRQSCWINLMGACHHLEDIAQANRLGLDAILLSPVLPTPTHPEALPLGWPGFAELAAHADMPIYALGGLQRSDLLQVQTLGGYGVAGMRDFISQDA